MQRYLLFAGLNYYPQEAWKDFKAQSDSIDYLVDIMLKTKEDWFQIVDTETMQIVKASE